jgi:2',3'-cyclic-nucleotide 2'-phosphodiesterase (5'-nucleotidase family)
MILSRRALPRLALFLALALAPLVALAQPVKVTFLHTNDVYEISPLRGRGGLAELAGAIKREKASAAHAVVTFGGDLISPSLMSGLTKGAQMIDVLNAIGIDFAVLGNHEFDFGDEVLRARMSESKFPWLATNVTQADGKIFHNGVATAIRDYGGIKVGFFGITTPETSVLASPGKETRFAGHVETAERSVKALRDQGAEVIVALTHLNIAEDREIARRVKGISLILGGHDHEPLTVYENDALIHKSGSDAAWLGVVELTVTRRPQQSGAPRIDVVPGWKMVPVVGGVGADPEIAALVKTHNDKLDSELNVAIGTAGAALVSKRDLVRTEETSIGNLFCDAIRETLGADIGLTNGGNIRGDKVYEPGTTLTRRDILTELPFGNRTVLLELKGADLREALENAVSRVEEKQGRFMQVSGLTLVYDPKAERGRRVVEIKVGGAPLDPARVYKVATNEYVAAGGDGFEALKRGRSLIDESAAKLMASQVIDYVAAKGTVAPKVEGRIVAR